MSFLYVWFMWYMLFVLNYSVPFLYCKQGMRNDTSYNIEYNSSNFPHPIAIKTLKHYICRAKCMTLIDILGITAHPLFARNRIIPGPEEVTVQQESQFAKHVIATNVLSKSVNTR